MENFRFFNLHFAFIQLTAVQPEDTDEEIVVCLALVDAIIMTFLRQMHVGYLLLGTIHIIYILQIRIFEGWNRGCPIATIAHYQLSSNLLRSNPKTRMKKS